jgi:8-oxo-dGTP pyrophosphatase MutT (NUDIX family)
MKSNRLLEQARERLASHADGCMENIHSAGCDAQALKLAAVLIPLLEADDGWHLLFIRRAENGNDCHSGQVAFPGGCVEPSDVDLKSTALREAFEEIGVTSQDVDVLGQLPQLISTTSYRIAPFVGVIPWPYRLCLASDEVARAFTIPLDWLSDSANYEICEHALPERKVPVIRYRVYDGELLWGATARITRSLLQTLAVIGGVEQQRVAMR